MTDKPGENNYDPIAEEYTRRMLHELDYKPRDRELLDQFATKVPGHGRVADIGCGPGQVTRYLYERGVDAFGIDLSPAMVERAAQAHPGIEFQQGDMRALPLPDASVAGIAAFYCIIHIPKPEVVEVLKEMRRVLQKDGVLLISFHRGSEVRHFEELWGQPVLLDFVFFERAEMVGYLEAAGFTVDEIVERSAYPEEVQTERVYIFAHK